MPYEARPPSLPLSFTQPTETHAQQVFSPKDVNNLHNADDLDNSAFSHHHTLGTGKNQAAPGNIIAGLFHVSTWTNTAAQTMATGAFTTVTPWINSLGLSENENNYYGFTQAAGVLTCKTAGLYHVLAFIQFSAGPGSRRIARIVKNSTEVMRNDIWSSDACSPFVGGYVKLAVGDTFSISGWQNSGAGLPLIGTSTLQVVRLR